MPNLFHRIRANDFLNVFSDDELNRVAKPSISLRSPNSEAIGKRRLTSISDSG